jgi:hypothetical protein
MLTKAQKQSWIDALRSGKYTQGQGYLKIDGRHCCLGVACELFAAEAGAVPKDHIAHGRQVTSFEKFDSGFGPRMMNFTGLTSLGDFWTNEAWKDSLPAHIYAKGDIATINDSGDYSFQDIANIIEAYLNTSD